MRFWVGVTDNSWYGFLSRSGVDEVNFWQPSGTAPFSHLAPGAPFLFKLKRPHHHIAGGGWFVKFSRLPLSLAWEAFEHKNGAANREEFEALIRALARNRNERDPEIGCTVLTAPFFWSQDHWIAEPPGFAPNIVRGRFYDTTQADGVRLWARVRERLDVGTVDALRDTPDGVPRYGDLLQVRQRLGQGAFRVLVTDAYQRHCAITGESTLPVLEAAHIKPYAESGPHDLGNGLLLRSDFHKLFDTGLVTVTEDYRVLVSPRIREAWFNGKAYYRLHGKALANLPANEAERPAPAFLRWHNENRYVE